jgi:hypothetical protein
MDDEWRIEGDGQQSMTSSLTKIDENQYKTDLGITIYAGTEEHHKCLHDLLEEFKPYTSKRRRIVCDR